MQLYVTRSSGTIKQVHIFTLNVDLNVLLDVPLDDALYVAL